MKTQFLRFGLLILLIVTLPLEGRGQSITQINSLTEGAYNSRNLPDGFFTATRGSQSAENNNLYFTDGTATGTVQLTQSPIGLFTNGQNIPTVIGKTLFFTQADGIYKSDGTPSGTILVKAGTFISNGIIYKNQLFFRIIGTDNVSSIWKTDGTPQGTVEVKHNLGFQNATIVQDKLFFTSGNILYSSDGTEVGTQPVKTFTTGDFPNTVNIVSASSSKLIVSNLYYTNASTQVNQFYISDGTSAGTVPLTTATTPTLRIIGYSLKDNLFYFFGGDKTIWRSDGTVAGTVSTLIVYGDAASTLITNDGLFLYSPKILKVVNGQATDLLGNSGYVFTTLPDAASVANVFANLNGILYFNATNQRTTEIWRSDGTVNGTYSLSTADDKATGRFVRAVFNINNTIYLSESIQKYNVSTQTSSERGQITRIEKSAGNDARKVILADQDVSLASIATITNGKAFCYGFTAANVFKAVYGIYVFDPGAVSSCSLSITSSTSITSLCTGTTTVLSSTTTGGTTPLTYQWSLNGTAISGATSATYAASAAGTYAVSVTDSKTCTAISPALVINVAAPPTSVTATNSGPYDAGQTIQLNASGGTTYSWKGPNNFTASTANPTISNATTAYAGSYTVTVSTSSACPMVTATTTVTIRGVLLPPTIAASQLVVCAGSAVALTAQGCAGTVRWSSGQTGASISVQPTAPTTYTAVCDVDGRSSSASNSIAIGVTAAPATPTITASNTQVMGGSSVTLIVGTGTTGSLQWLLGDTPIAGATQNNYITTQAGNYSLRITNASGCTAVSNILTINLITAVEPVGVLSENQVTVYPNPTSGDCWVTIEVLSKQIVSLNVLDALGKSVRQWSLQAIPNRQPIRVTLPNIDGLYFLRVETDKGAVIKKVMRVK